MSVTVLLAVACIVLGLAGAILEDRILFGALEWFVLALAFNTLAVDFKLGGRR